MSKEYFLQLANYNIWANHIVFSWLNQIDDEQWTLKIISSFTSVRETALHLASSENLWHERLDKKGATVLPTTFKGSKKDLINLWQKASEDLKLFVENLDESKLPEILHYKNTKGLEFNLPIYQILAHVFNHSTYHRGQLVTMLRQAGFTGVGSTDLTSYYRQL